MTVERVTDQSMVPRFFEQLPSWMANESHTRDYAMCSVGVGVEIVRNLRKLFYLGPICVDKDSSRKCVRQWDRAQIEPVLVSHINFEGYSAI